MEDARKRRMNNQKQKIQLQQQQTTQTDSSTIIPKTKNHCITTEMTTKGSTLRKKAVLDCKPYGGPSNAFAQRMVYWYDIPSDTAEPPFYDANTHDEDDEEQYLIFEMDEAGWNNVRMSFETTVALAIAMKRTLVLPPKQRISGLFGKHTADKAPYYSLEDIFPLKRTKLLKIITFEEFITIKVIKEGQIIDPTTNQSSYPPLNITKWDNLLLNSDSIKRGYGKLLFKWLRSTIPIVIPTNHLWIII